MTIDVQHSPAAAPARRRHSFGERLQKHRGLLTAIAVFVVLFLVVDWISAGPLSYFDVSFMASGGATLALAAVGQTLVIGRL